MTEVFVEDIPRSWTVADVETVFTGAGAVQRVELHSDGRGKVYYKTMGEALAAVLLLDGRTSFRLDATKQCDKALQVYVLYPMLITEPGMKPEVADDDDTHLDTEESWESDEDDVDVEALKRDPKYAGCFFDADRFNAVYLNDSILSWAKPPSHMDVPIASHCVVSPSNFYVQFIHTEGQLKMVNEKLNAHCNNLEYVKYFYNLKEICLARFGDQWRRAVVIDKPKDNQCQYKVQFLDYGYSALVDADQMRPMVRSLAHTPFQAYHCGVHGIAPIGGKWSEEAVQYFQEIMDTDLVKSVRVIEERDDGRDLVKLETEDENAPICADVGDLLIKRGYAKAI